MSWHFALINKRLAEFFFKKKCGRIMPQGHCYMTRENCDTAEEQKWIDEDIKKHSFTYRSGKYRHIPTGKIFSRHT